MDVSILISECVRNPEHFVCVKSSFSYNIPMHLSLNSHTHANAHKCKGVFDYIEYFQLLNVWNNSFGQPCPICQTPSIGAPVDAINLLKGFCTQGKWRNGDLLYFF